jgi:putative transposase
MLRKWFGASRFVYNKTVEYLGQPGTRASWMSIKGGILSDLPEWLADVPYQIKSIAIKDACTAVKAAKKKCLSGSGFNRVKFRARKDPRQSVYIPKSSVKETGVYVRLLGQMKYAENIPSDVKDCRLTLHAGRYYLCAPSENTATRTENQGRVVSLDPGVRTFLTYFHEHGCGKLGEGDFGRIQRLCWHLDRLISCLSSASSARRRRMKKAADRLRHRITDLVDELHWKCCRFLVDNFDVILLPTFETSQMSSKARRKIDRKSVRMMLTFSHFKFKQRLRQKAFEAGAVVLDVDEAYTSKTVSWTGELVSNLGGAKTIRSRTTGEKMDRDYNGARGIMLRALGDSPLLRKAFVSGC